MTHSDALENLNQDLRRRLGLPASGLIQSADSLSFLAEEIGRIPPEECAPADLLLREKINRDLLSVSQKTSRALLADAQQLVAANAGYTLDTIDQARADLSQALQQVSQADKLGGSAAVDTEQRNRLDQDIAALQARLRNSERFINVRDSIVKLQVRALGLESTDPVRAVDLYNEARAEAQNAVAATDWGDEERDALHKIHGDARARYDEIRKRLEIPTTLIAGQTVEAVRLFARLDKSYPAGQNHPGRKVNYFSGPSLLDTPRVLDVEEALPIARIKLVNHWDERVQEYIRQSVEFLAGHKPRDAQISLEQWQQLPGLNDELVGVAFPENLRIRINETQKRIQPELKQFLLADKHLERALQKLDKPEEAQKDFVVAQDAYPFHPALADVSTRIAMAARSRLEDLLAQADVALAQESSWRQAESKLNAAAVVLNEFAGLRVEFESRHEALKQVCELVVQCKPRGGNARRLNAAEEREILGRLRDLLEADETSYWHSAGWQNTRNRLSALESESIVQDTLDRARQVCAVEANHAEMGEVLRDIGQLQQEPLASLAVPSGELLERMRRQLVAWMGYAEARDQIRLHDEGQPADLSVVQQGLASARQAQMLPAGKLRELQSRLKELEQDDIEAHEALLAAQALRRSPPDTEDAALAWHRSIEKWVNCTTSYRAEFLRLRSSAETNAQRVLEREIKLLVDVARDTHFETLDVRRLEALCNSGRSVIAGPDTPWETWLNSPPALMARAAQHERDARREPALWQSVENQWKVIVNKLTTSDTEFAFCELKMKQAHKQAVLQAARTTERHTAERMLGELLKDPLLSLDADVWLLHGQHCLESVRLALEDEMDGAAHARPPAQAARTSLMRAQQFDSTRAAATAGVAELGQWDCVLEAELEISAALRVSGNGRLTREHCAAAVEGFKTTPVNLTPAGRQAKAFAAFWESQKRAARALLDRQWAEANLSTFDKLDTLTAMLTLAPEDENVQAQLSHELLNARQEFARRVTEVVGDYDGSKFKARHPGVEATGIQRDQTAVKQRDEVAGLMKYGSEIVAAHRLVERQMSGRGGYASNFNSSDILNRELTDLERWQQDLTQLIDALIVAGTRATRGLQSPREFDAARHALRMQQSYSASGARARVPQIPEVFSGHPDVDGVKALLNANTLRHASQRKLAREIEICLANVAAAQPAQLAGWALQTGTDEFTAPFDAETFLGQLRDRMAAGLNQALPLEIALEKLQQMRREEPDDACGLQARLRFIDHENGNREYSGDHDIENVLAPRARQIALLRDWLAAYKSDLRLTGIDFPGAVNFDAIVPGIQRTRDGGPIGLIEAKKRCAEVRAGSGDDEKLVDGLWPLERMRDALSTEALRAHLAARQPKPNGLSQEMESAAPVILCAAAKGLDEEREALRSSYERQLAACLACEQDIQQRIRQYEEAWLRFETAYADLMKMKRRWVGARRISQSEQWMRFRESAEAFCHICPDDKDFKDRLAEVRNKLDLVAGCSDGQAGAR